MCFFSYACQGADDQFLIRLNKVRMHGEAEDPVCGVFADGERARRITQGREGRLQVQGLHSMVTVS